jgi:hypothetical protein
MSEDYSKLTIEERLTLLEKVTDKQNAKIKVLTTMLIFKKSSLLFDSPFKQFLGDADAFFDYFYEDPGACYNNCFRDWQSDIKAAGNDQDKKLKADKDQRACIANCPPLVPQIQL